MQTGGSTARRYHWHSSFLSSFVDEPHTGICGTNQGSILNMVAKEASVSRDGVMALTVESPKQMLAEAQKLVMPAHHDVRSKDVDLKRLGSILWLAHDKRPSDFEELLLLEGVGPRTLQSLALVSEVIYGTPSRFKDPARFSFAHGGKDGHPFPVPIKVYDETISTLQTAVHKAKMGNSDKQQALRKLSEIAQKAEADFQPNNNFEQLIERERNESWRYGGRTVFGKAKPPVNQQLKLF